MQKYSSRQISSISLPLPFKFGNMCLLAWKGSAPNLPLEIFFKGGFKDAGCSFKNFFHMKTFMASLMIGCWPSRAFRLRRHIWKPWQMIMGRPLPNLSNLSRENLCCAYIIFCYIPNQNSLKAFGKHYSKFAELSSAASTHGGKFQVISGNFR